MLGVVALVVLAEELLLVGVEGEGVGEGGRHCCGFCLGVSLLAVLVGVCLGV